MVFVKRCQYFQCSFRKKIFTGYGGFVLLSTCFKSVFFKYFVILITLLSCQIVSRMRKPFVMVLQFHDFNN